MNKIQLGKSIGICKICKIDFIYKASTQLYCCKKCFIEGRKIRMKNIRKLNLFKIKEKKKREYIKNSDYYKEKTKLWKKDNPEKHREQVYRWARKNKEKVKEIRRKHNLKRRSTSHGTIDHRMEVSIRKSLFQNKNGKKWQELVGYSINDLKIELGLEENNINILRFNDIDHRIPKSLFIYTNENDVEFKLCWNKTNLILKNKKENYIKHNYFAEPSRIQLENPVILHVLLRNGYGACTSCGTWHPKEGRCAPLSEEAKKAKQLLEEMFPKEKPL